MTQTSGDFIVGIPTLTRYDYLKACLSSILLGSLQPWEICVVDNGGHFDERIIQGTPQCRVRVVRPGYNLGVAGSWNLIHSLYAPEDIVFCNDDVMFGPRALEQLMAHDDAFVPANPHQAWSCFLQREVLWNAVGEYDDGFWPAYFEDNDYVRRMSLSGFAPSPLKHSLPITHVGSSTGGLAFARFEWNKQRYALKWGGVPGQETFSVPWNGLSHDELKFYFERACAFSTDIQEHCPTLARLSAECDHVTELGSGTGTSTTALLRGEPRRLVCYDIHHASEFDNVIRIARRPGSATSFMFHEQSALESDIEPTDLLFIDTLHVAEQLREELRMHALKVRKFIVLHDTVTFGEHGEIGGHAGLLQALDEFVEQNAEWAVKEQYDNNNGLTVLARHSLVTSTPVLRELQEVTTTE